ncbi:MAG: GTPase Era [Betaproteobacteria bacterium]
MPTVTAFRCGHVAIVGRPNVGKSTLLNHLVGQKVSITSKKAQTTRHQVTGILTTVDAQFIFVDTPGFQTLHRSRLNMRMNRAVTEGLSSVDAVIVVIEAGRTVPADRSVMALLPRDTHAVAALNKIDQLDDRDVLLPQMAELAAAYPFDAIVPVSAGKDRGLHELAAALRPLLPERTAMYGNDEFTDRDERFLASELIREKIFRLLGEEVPYAATVAIDQFVLEGEMRRIHATVYVERANQRAILLGAGGVQMKEIASRAREDMERMFGGRVFLEVWVKVKRGWADDDNLLQRFGY